MSKDKLEKLFDIIFEDASLLVVCKPAGLVCHPTKNGELSSLIGRARLYLSRADSNINSHASKSETPRLVNRLDRETSGIVLIAKNADIAGELGKILEGRGVQKEYLAIVHGHVRENHGLIDAPLGKDEGSVVAVKDCVRAGGAPSLTEFFVERRFLRAAPAAGAIAAPPLPFSLLRIIPHTGRKHQIRIHLAHVGHPIVGDKLYGGDEDCYLALAQNRLTDAHHARLIFENHALHARAIKFRWRGHAMEFYHAPEQWFTEFLTDRR
ncbi:MAG TPA: RluA family pseudouridine synthase [Verrucomicrobiae bacterium]|nr:RluA family pseudouridine synthase [Verrucomicrobiae bacterium]